MSATSDSFWKRVKKTSGCWSWIGFLDRNGYGRHGSQLAHRVVFELINKPAPTHMYIDHICRNRKCVRPSHLRFVTPKQSALENCNSLAALNSKKKKCLRGHLFNKENTSYYFDKKNNKTLRRCAKCKKINNCIYNIPAWAKRELGLE